MRRKTRLSNLATAGGLAIATLIGLSTMCGCIVVGASSRGGAFIWPGGLGLIVMLLVVFLLMRRR